MKKLSEAQMAALQSVQNWSRDGAYMPFAVNARSFEACRRQGLLAYRSVSDGHPTNGYTLTEAGRAAIRGKDNDQ